MAQETSSNSLGGCLYLIFRVCTAMIGYSIHKSVFWSVVDFIFTPVVWVKWILCYEVTLKIIKETFSWFFN